MIFGCSNVDATLLYYCSKCFTPRPHFALSVFDSLVQSALFDLSQFITVILLLICVCTYVRGYRKGIFDAEDGSHHGLRGGKSQSSSILSYHVSVPLRVPLLLYRAISGDEITSECTKNVYHRWQSIECRSLCTPPPRSGLVPKFATYCRYFSVAPQ